MREESAALPDATSSRGVGAGKGLGERSRFGETCRGSRRSRAAYFADPALELAITPAPAAFDILGLEECTKATTSRDEPVSEPVACLLINAKPIPGSRLDAFLFLAVRESLCRTADPEANFPEAVYRYEAAAGRRLPRAMSLPSFGAVERRARE